MKKYRIEDMTRGWFVGEFSPTAFNTKDCEVGYKTYKAGDNEPAHVHKVATELTLITSGTVQMNNKQYKEGDIVVISPGEIVKFKAITDATNVVFKLPSVKGDKYIVEEK
jgi:quercetin dioxygenase-like cupin family protein